MKIKFLLGMILGFGFISSVYGAKSGVFIGADVGVNYHVSEGKVIFSSPGNAYTSESNDYLFDLSYGLRGGFQYYFTPKVGLRVVGAFGKGNYSEGEANDGETYGFFRYAGNVDFLYQFGSSEINQVGVFVGAGYEGIGGELKKLLDDTKGLPGHKYNTSGIFMNLGLQVIRDVHHQFDFIVRVPFYSYLERNFSTNAAQGNITINSSHKNNYSFNIAYTYVF
ncbi:outer membrane beta-barrel protein [Helicobacter typhlonius]|uniref:outer membrane beta-barrel protein n=2 Tax=Helicobacter TaxID=209 RepID=UPI0025D2979D|nr:outer membrane beta-barrel protein [uncultured Helicobacter sp.]